MITSTPDTHPHDRQHSLLSDRLRQGALGVSESLALGASLLEALDRNHREGRAGLDIRPSRIVISASGPAADVSDRDADQDLASLGELDIERVPEERVRYLAPEAAGLVGWEVGPQADLYSVGAILFECLAGQPMIEGRGAAELLRQNLSASGRSLQEAGVDVPAVLDEFVGRLAYPDPAARYATAAGALADLVRIRAALEAGNSDPEVPLGARDLRDTLTETVMVGRRTELEALAHEMDGAAIGAGGTVLLEGESGSGKSRLLSAVTRRAQVRKFAVFRGQGVDKGGQGPYQALAGVVDGLAHAAMADPSFRERLLETVGGEAQAVGAIFPRLAAVLWPELELPPGPAIPLSGPSADSVAGPVEEVQPDYLHGVVASLLRAAGSPVAPAILVVDDFQWADEASVKVMARFSEASVLEDAPVLEEASAPRRPPAKVSARQRESEIRQVADACYTMAVIAFRSEEKTHDDRLRRIRTARHLVLGPMAVADLERALASMAGPLPAEAAGAVASLAGGNPFMAAAYLRGLVEQGALVGGATGWQLQPDRLAELRSSSEAAALLKRRLALLPDDVSAALAIGAVLGKEFDVGVAAHLAGAAPERAAKRLEEARRRHLIRIRGDQASFTHDKLRESVLASIPPEERRRLHLAAATHIEGRSPENAFDLAYHFDAASEHGRALPHAMAAAARARAGHALDLAERYYRMAERGLARADGSTALSLEAGLGEVLMLRGNYAEAVVRYDSARDLAGDPLTRARVEDRLSEVHFKRVDYTSSLTAAEEGLRLLGQAPPNRMLAFAGLLPVELARLGMRRAFRIRTRPADTPEAERDLLAVRLFNRLTYLWFFARAGKVAAFWACIRGINLGERYVASRPLAEIYTTLVGAVGCALPPADKLAFRVGEAALRMHRQTGNLGGEGRLNVYLCAPAVSSFQAARTLELSCQATRILERTGDRWDLNAARWASALALLLKGDLEGSARESRQLYQQALAIGDFKFVGNALFVWARASAGRVPADYLRTELDRPQHFAHTMAELRAAEGIRLLAAGRPAEAALSLEAGRRQMYAAGMQDMFVSPMLPWLVTALRTQAESALPMAARRRRALLWRAAHRGAESLAMSFLFPNDRAHALRECGLVFAHLGFERTAAWLLDRAVEFAERTCQPYEHAQSLAARGALRTARGIPDAGEDLAAARAISRYVEQSGQVPGPRSGDARVALSLAERFDGLLKAGRRIVAISNPADVVPVALDAGKALLRAEEAVYVEIEREDHADRDVEAGGLTAPGPRQPAESWLVAEARREGKSVMFRSDMPQEGNDAMLASGIRSALGVPVRVRDRIAGCMIFTHRQVGGLFGEPEARLADFLGALAGAALENAEDRASRQELEALRRTDELKDQFLSILSHELRTPINAVMGFGSILQDEVSGPLSEQQQGFLEKMMGGADTLLGLVEDLLDMSRIQAGKFSVESEPIDARDAIASAFEATGPLEVSKGVTRRLDLPGALPLILADRRRLIQVLMNLIGNAIKFTPKGGEVLVRVRPRGKDLLVEVTDTGVGIDPDDIPKLFRRFGQLDMSSTRQAGGTGLGLSICKAIVEAHGGAIGVESAPSAGSTFWFTVPLAEAV